MNLRASLPAFRPGPPDAAGILSWIHLGDLHMRQTGDQNALDLKAIVRKLNSCYGKDCSFVYLPGDNADRGDAEGYTVVRGALNQLLLPWCAIVGDHDVVQESFAPFLRAMSARTHFSFVAGEVRFVALNAFERPAPDSFCVLEDQIAWLTQELEDATAAGQRKVVLMHCYPTDLKQGGEQITALLHRHKVLLVDMGHTHYNEISNDGHTLYAATRSTGQIEEGPVGFSVLNVDDGVLSWKFFELIQPVALMITSPSDERLLTADHSGQTARAELRVRAKMWCAPKGVEVMAQIGEQQLPMRRSENGLVWEASFSTGSLQPGLHAVRVQALADDTVIAEDAIRWLHGPRTETVDREARDQNKALEAWPEHGLLGTQLGPNKNGRAW